MAIRVLLADDHSVVRKGIREFLADEPDIEVVGEARDGREAVDLAVALQPDTVVMDIAMPELTVLRLAGRGLTNKQIGVDLRIRDRTVQNHLANIYAKLGAASRTEAVTRAVQRGLFRLGN